MQEIKNIGYIYKITNLVNGKIYIGQTSQPINERWRGHLKDSKNPKYALQKAIKKYGEDSFKIEEVEKCEIKNLNEREIYWISFYDSFNSKKGYNLTLGGSGGQKYFFDEEKIIEEYEKLKSYEKVSNLYGCSSGVIKRILNKHNIYIETVSERGFSIKRYSLDGIFLQEYDSLHQAGKWINENLDEFKERTSVNISHCLNSKIITSKNFEAIYAGFLWKSESISKECIENYYKREKSKNKNQKQNKKKKYENSKKICPICGINNMNNQSSMCKDCFNNKKNKDFLESLDKKISKTKLMKLVREESFLQIGKKYNVSDNAIKKWCKNYLIPFRKEDIKNISDENWIKECNLSKEEYELKYCQIKQKNNITSIEIIECYKRLKSIKSVCTELSLGRDYVKKILDKNNIEILNSGEVIRNCSEVETIYRIDSNTNKVLEIYPTYKEAVEFIQKTNSAKYKTIKDRIREACKHQTKVYGYYWKKELKEN